MHIVIGAKNLFCFTNVRCFFSGSHRPTLGSWFLASTDQFFSTKHFIKNIIPVKMAN